MIMIDLH